MKAIITKYHGPSNTKGSRISAVDSDGNRATVSFDHSLSRDAVYASAALALCRKMNWKGTLQAGWTKDGCVFTFIDESSQYKIDV